MSRTRTRSTAWPTARGRGVRGQRAEELLVPPVRLSLGAVLAVNTGRLMTRLAAGIARHPATAAMVIGLVLLWVLLGPARLLALAAIVAAILSVWRRVHGGSFARWVACPVRSRWRAWSVYRRHWEPVMATTGLTTSYDGAEFVPRLRKVVTGACVDRLLVQLLAGQAPGDYADQVDSLAHTFGALGCRVRVDRPGWVWLDLTHADPLTAPIVAVPVVDVPDLAALPLGRAEDGTPWLLRLLGSHVLIAGATGSGKGSVIWSLIRALAGGIRAGVVQVWALDPKGGMELAFGAPLFTRLAYRTVDDMLLVLEDAAAAMRHRQARLVGITRLHRPSVGEPLIVVLVDELAALTAYTDRDTRGLRPPGDAHI